MLLTDLYISLFSLFIYFQTYIKTSNYWKFLAKSNLWLSRRSASKAIRTLLFTLKLCSMRSFEYLFSSFERIHQIQNKIIPLWPSSHYFDICLMFHDDCKNISVILFEEKIMNRSPTKYLEVWQLSVSWKSAICCRFWFNYFLLCKDTDKFYPYILE